MRSPCWTSVQTKVGDDMTKKLKLYALSTCIHCKHTREFLDRLKADYDCVYVDKLSGDERKAMIEEVRAHNPDLSFPTLLIGDKCIVGFKMDEIKEAFENL